MKAIARLGAALLVAASAIAVAPAVAHAFSYKPTIINFGAVPVGTTKTLTVTFKLDAGYAFDRLSGPGLNPPFGVNAGTCTNGATGKSCKFIVAFTPTALGPVSPSSLGADECPVVPGPPCVGGGIAIEASGGAASIKPTTLGLPAIIFGNVALGKSKSKTVKLTPDPGYQWTEFDGAQAFTPPFALDTGTCTLPAGACKFKETFSPTSLGTVTAGLDAVECPIGGGACVTYTIGFGGTGGVFSAKPVQMGSVPVGTSKSKSLTVKLDTGYTLQPATPFFPWSINLNDCVGLVAKSCKITMTFSPDRPGLGTGALFLQECPIVSGPCIEYDDPIDGHGGA